MQTLCNTSLRNDKTFYKFYSMALPRVGGSDCDIYLEGK